MDRSLTTEHTRSLFMDISKYAVKADSYDALSAYQISQFFNRHESTTPKLLALSEGNWKDLGQTVDWYCRLPQYVSFNRDPRTSDEFTYILHIVRAVGAGMAKKGLVAVLSEVTAGPFIKRLRDTMLLHETGRRILRERPRITSKTLPLEELQRLPEDTVGRTDAEWIKDYRMSPDGRDDVRYIGNPKCAYVMQRYRECHDLYHAIFGIPPYVEGELALKAFEFANTSLPMNAFSIFAVVKLKPEERRRFFNVFFPCAAENGLRSEPIINFYWEQELQTDVNSLLGKMGAERPPDLRVIRKKERIRDKAKEAHAG